MARWLNNTDEKMNEAVCIKNHVSSNGGGKRRVKNFKRQEFWRRIGCILSAVTSGIKWHKLWSDTTKYSSNMAPTKEQIDVRGKTNLYKVCCAHYHHFYIYAFHSIILSYTNLFISWMFLWVTTSLYPYRFVVYILDKFEGVQESLVILIYLSIGKR